MRIREVMVEAIRASGAEMVTVAVRRVDLDRSDGILQVLDPKEFFLLANTAGCFTADDAVRYARLARAAGFNEWIKLEVIGDVETLLPDTQATLEAARVLVGEGFKVMAYTNDDLVTALRLEDAGCVSVMPLASPIGSGLGVVNPYFIREIKRRLSVPVIVDAGVGTASDACITMEQGSGRDPHEHCPCRRRRSCRYGAGDVLRGACWPARLQGRAGCPPGRSRFLLPRPAGCRPDTNAARGGDPRSARSAVRAPRRQPRASFGSCVRAGGPDPR